MHQRCMVAVTVTTQQIVIIAEDSTERAQPHQALLIVVLYFLWALFQALLQHKLLHLPNGPGNDTICWWYYGSGKFTQHYSRWYRSYF